MFLKEEKMFSNKVMSLIFALAIAGVANAVPYNLEGCWVEVDYWAGTGSNETIVVIDWNQTNGPYITESHAWGFRWDGTAYLSDALAAIDAAGALDITTGYGGAFLNDAFYYDPSIDSDNHTSAGYTGWWWLGDTTDCGATWTANAGGLTSEVLGHGKVEGLNMDSGEWHCCPSIPVPEPMTIALLGLGGLLLRRCRA
jgi:hypothetical protein